MTVNEITELYFNNEVTNMPDCIDIFEEDFRYRYLLRLKYNANGDSIELSLLSNCVLC